MFSHVFFMLLYNYLGFLNRRAPFISRFPGPPDFLGRFFNFSVFVRAFFSYVVVPLFRRTPCKFLLSSSNNGGGNSK